MRRILCAALLAALCLGLLPGAGERAPDLAFTAAYAVDADLDPAARTMTYTETATVTNTGTDSAEELYFHIYANMFKHLYKVADGDVAVLAVTDGSGRALEYARSQEGVLYRVALAEPLAPGGTAEVTLSCRVDIPDLERKYGVSPDGDVHLPSFAAQLAVYNEDGWDTDPLPEEGDGRYAAVADYDLTVRAPAGYTLACNGTQTAAVTQDGVTTWRFRAEKRRDLVLIACENYVCLERTVGGTAVLGYFNDTVPNVTPEQMDEVMDNAAFALEYFNSFLPEYPYDTLVVTNAALGSNFAVNMEYPGLITVYFDGQGARTGTYHETAHQWFYGLVGNDENTQPWLDEAFATFATGLCLEAAGVPDVDGTYWDIYAISDEAMRGQKIDVGPDEAEVYEFLIYNRGCMFLKHLMEAVGREDFLSILADYCQAHMYGIADTEDFLAALAAGTDADVSALLAEYIG